ncbi:helix-turn-helix transcriptional regulator [Roseovarius nubinhibens]|uniref:Autoinducer-binding transcriptional regulator LuxR n=1 Tax=Roseovarius nubinhibens (strain ATCC BAA-591 / DSM 15170 / ISM) TaxID=89187 RepID=A3SQM2_ROSNI|nr:LuxR family transcriptional regulator [Roseovarius nubinhibens]EAP75431.1 autoinducer-binding transcriptional regulator LuxR [Roseovarius nubinhibens ISM]
MKKLATERLTTILSRLDTEAGLSSLPATVEALRRALKVDQILFCSSTGPDRSQNWHTLPPGWTARYAQQGYHRIDPVRAEAQRRVTPFDWRPLDWQRPAARALRADAVAHGIGPQGFTIPAHGPNGQLALLSITADRDDATWTDLTRANRFALILAAHALHHKIMSQPDAGLGEDPDSAAATPPAPRLSPRETDVITLLARGDSRGQIATKLAISEHTLRSYIETARHKLGAVNTPHAVARAIAMGMIPLA